MHMMQIRSEKSESKHPLFVHALTVNNLYWRHIKISATSDTAKSKVHEWQAFLTASSGFKEPLFLNTQKTGSSGFSMELKEMGKNGIRFSFLLEQYTSSQWSVNKVSNPASFFFIFNNLKLLKVLFKTFLQVLFYECTSVYHMHVWYSQSPEGGADWVTED